MNTQEELDYIEKRIDELDDILEKKDKLWDFSKPFDKYNEYRKSEISEQSRLYARKRMIMEPTYENIPDYGNVMPLDTFIYCVKEGEFIDYDGYGHYIEKFVEKDMMTNIEIYPSDVKNGNIRKEFSKIIWFNR